MVAKIARYFIAKAKQKFSLFGFLAFSYLAFCYLWIDGFYFIERFNAIGLNVQGQFGLSERIRQSVFIIEYVLAISILYRLSKTRSLFRILFLILAWILIIIDTAAHEIYNRPADLGNIATLNASIASFTDALQEYISQIIQSTLKTSVLFAPLLINIYRNKNKNKDIDAILLIFLVLLAAIYGTILIKRGSPALVGFPKGFSYAFGSIALKLNSTFFQAIILQTEKYDPPEFVKNKIKNVIAIVDESIEYEIFEKYLTSDNINIIDFGRAFSGANCSASSNYIIRKGYWARTDENNINIRETHSLFEIAKRNGFTTTYIDNQNILQDPTIRNYINDQELGFIDRIIENNGAQYDRDDISFREIKNLLHAGNNFIFLNKAGAHFPYKNSLPPDLISNKKTMDYEKSVQINAAQFVEKLSSIAPKDTIFFYTSDHGQELNSRGTHCNTGEEISTNEYSVPFVIITANTEAKKLLTTQRFKIENELTHIEFSETIRNFLGEKIPGAPSILSPQNSHYAYCGLYGQPISFFGELPSCKRLPVSKE